MKTNNSSDEPVSMFDITFDAILDEYTDYALSLLELDLEPDEVLSRLTSFAESRRPEIEASLMADFDPISVV
jgi:hypothetical protein